MNYINICGLVLIVIIMIPNIIYMKNRRIKSENINNGVSIKS